MPNRYQRSNQNPYIEEEQTVHWPKRYQRSNQNPYIEEEQTAQWPKRKVQKDKQRSTKHTYTTTYRVTRTPLKTGDELRCSGGVGSSCSTSNTRRVNLGRVSYAQANATKSTNNRKFVFELQIY